MSMIDLMQSLEMGQKSCRLIVAARRRAVRTVFFQRAMPRREDRKIEGDALFTKSCCGRRANSRIDFNAANSFDKNNNTRTPLAFDGSDAADG